MAKSVVAYLYATLTQGGADAFVQGSISTGLTGLNTTAYQLRELVIEYGVAGSGQGVSSVTSNWEIAITRKSMTAMPVITEKSVIAKFKRSMSLTTSGAVIADTVARYTWDEDNGPLIVEDPFYAQLDTAATTAVNVVEMRFGYVQVKVSEVDRLQLITNSLQ